MVAPSQVLTETSVALAPRGTRIRTPGAAITASVAVRKDTVMCLVAMPFPPPTSLVARHRHQLKRLQFLTRAIVVGQEIEENTCAAFISSIHNIWCLVTEPTDAVYLGS
jgi:hypothetical protein